MTLNEAKNLKPGDRVVFDMGYLQAPYGNKVYGRVEKITEQVLTVFWDRDDIKKENYPKGAGEFWFNYGHSFDRLSLDKKE